FLPLSIATWWGKAPADATAAFWLLGLFAVSIGLPFFALSANGPLLQAWFARTDHPSAANPYFLYAATHFPPFLSLLPSPSPLAPLRGRAVDGAGQAALRVGGPVPGADGADRMVRPADAPVRAARRRGERRAHAGAELDAGGALDRARRGAVGAAHLGHGAYL